jgi:DNA-binding CsgD family transcriptional regulator
VGFAKAPARTDDDVVRLEDALRERLTVSSRHMSPPRSRRPALSDVELDVLKGIAAGVSQAALARRLGLGEALVAAHVARILEKLGVVTAAEAPS